MNFKIFSSETFQNPSVDTFNIPPFQLISQSTDLLLSIKFTILTFAINEQYSVLLLCFFKDLFNFTGKADLKRGEGEREIFHLPFISQMAASAGAEPIQSQISHTGAGSHGCGPSSTAFCASHRMQVLMTGLFH